MQQNGDKVKGNHPASITVRMIPFARWLRVLYLLARVLFLVTFKVRGSIPNPAETQSLFGIIIISENGSKNTYFFKYYAQSFILYVLYIYNMDFLTYSS